MTPEVEDFIDWLYDLGPEPTMPRERLIREYEDYLSREVKTDPEDI